MPSIGTLYSVPSMRQTKIILAAAAIGGLDLTIPTDYVHYESNKKPDFLAKFPHGKIPAFEGTDGLKLFEGLAIARYVASLAPNSGLLGSGEKNVALVDQWIYFIDSEVQGPQAAYLALVKGHITPFSKPYQTQLVEANSHGFSTLEAYLANRTFLVGERMTLADLCLAGTVQRAVEILLGDAERKKYPNIIRHFETIINTPKIKSIWGTTDYVETPLQFIPPPKEKKEKPAPNPVAPKAEKKPKAVVKDDDDDEDLVPAEAKAKNPLDDLPKSTFNMEDWKRAYSNMDTRGPGGALEWFYKNFDKDGFSIWRVDFKYNEELTQIFMSANQIGGFFNRLEGSRKYCFGSLGVLGEKNASIISGALILRGPDAVPVVSVAPDWESYEYKKLSLDNVEDKTFFEAALAWDLEIDGKKWADGKNFK